MTEINSKKKIYLINKLLVYNEKLENSVSKKVFNCGVKEVFNLSKLKKPFLHPMIKIRSLFCGNPKSAER